MARLSRGIGWLVGPIVFLLLIAGCGGGGGGGSGGSSERSVILDLLGTIPDTPEIRQMVLINDYARIRDVFNVQLPGPDADKEALEQYLLDISEGTNYGLAPSPFISGYGQYGLLRLDHPRYLGFDIREVDQTVEAGQLPGVLEVLGGRFDPDATDRALKGCSECPAPDRQERAGIKFYSWGEDLENDMSKRLSPPAFDQLGRGGRIAVLDDYVFRTVETPGMSALIDASQDNLPSLADAEEFRLLAQGMSTLEAYSMLFSDMTPDVGRDLEPWLSVAATTEDRLSMAELRKDFPILRTYQVFGTGMGRDGAGPYMAIVLVHADENSAAKNAELLRARFLEAPPLPSWDLEPFTGLVDSVETETDGRLLLAKVRGEHLSRRWLAWFYQLYPLLPHE